MTTKKEQALVELKEKYDFSTREIAFMQNERKLMYRLINNFGQLYLNAVDPELGKVPKIDAHSKRQLLLVINIYIQSKIGVQNAIADQVGKYVAGVIDPMMDESSLRELEYSDNEQDMLIAIQHLIEDEDQMRLIAAHIIFFLKAVSIKVSNRRLKTIKKNNFNTILKDLEFNLISFSMYNTIMDMADIDF